MRILYFYQYFSTPKGSWGTRVYEFAKNWVAAGHEVTVVTSVYYKSDLKTERVLDERIIDGIRVKIINLAIDNRHSFYRRVFSFLAFSLISVWYALTLPADVVVASSGPITVGLPGLVARYLRGRRLVFEVRDLWPQGVVELGVLKNGLVKWLAYRFEALCYSAASLIVALSPGMQRDIERRFKYDKVISVPNSANLALFATQADGSKLPEVFNKRKVAIYTGNIGEVNNSKLLLETAIELQKRGETQITLLLVGDGQQKEELRRRAVELGLSNFQILGLVPKEELVAMLQHSVASLITYRPAPILETSSPNKLFESLAAGVPVLNTLKGWTREMIEEHQCGFGVEYDDPRALADRLQQLAHDPQLVRDMGERARVLARSFDKDLLAARMLDAIEKCR